MNAVDFPDDYPFQNGPDGWPLVRAFFQQIHMLYGDPASIMFGRIREGAKRGVRNLAKKLRVMVALVRRLILIEALTLHPLEIKAGKKLGPRKRAYKVEIILLTAQPCVTFFNNIPRPTEDASAWRASLQLFPTIGRRNQQPIGRHHFRPKNPLRMLRRLALRLEALRRIAADPTKYALRYAQQMRTRPPLWLLEPFPGRAVDRANAHIVRPAHTIALQAALGDTS